MTITLLLIALLVGPPPLPFSLYGTIHTGSGAPYTATVGLPVYGICRAERVVTSTIFLNDNAAWYSLDVPGADETRAGCAPGDRVTFQVSRTPAAESAPTDDEGDTDEAHTDELRIAPGRAIELGDDAKVTAIPAGDLGSLVDTISTIVSFVAASTRTPHYYLRPPQGADIPSGEALKQLENALVARAKERFTVFGGSWVEALRVGARLWAAMGNRGADVEQPLEISWADPQVKNELYQADVATREQGLGVPQEVLWAKRLDYSPGEIANMRAMSQAAEAEKIATVIGALNRSGNEATAQPGRNGGGVTINA